jgi:hypothetical protein
VQQRHAEQGFQTADLVAERRLRDVQPRRRSSEMPLLGDRYEIAQEPQVKLIDRRNLPIEVQIVLDVRRRGPDTGLRTTEDL